MKLNTNIKKSEQLLIISGLIILPLLSFYLSSKASLFYENLTYVGNLSSNRTLFILWGIIQSFFYFICFYRLYHKLQMKQKWLISLSLLLTIISIIAFLVPFTNHSGDILSQFHIYGSMFSCLWTYLIIVYTLNDCAKYDFHYFIKCRNLLFLIVSIFAFCIILLGDISTISELVLLDGLNILFIYMLIQ